MTSGLLETIRDQQAAILAAYEHLEKRLEALERGARLQQEWYTLPQAAHLKGISEDSIREKTWLQPNGGKGRRLINGLYRWSRADVCAWLAQDDEELARLYRPEAA